MQNATPDNGRLTELIRATTTALQPKETEGKSKKEQKNSRRLADLFAAAQQADLQEKFLRSVMFVNDSLKTWDLKV